MLPVIVGAAFLVGSVAVLGYALLVLFRFAVLMHTGDGFANAERKEQGRRLLVRLAVSSALTIVVWNVGRAVLTTL